MHIYRDINRWGLVLTDFEFALLVMFVFGYLMLKVGYKIAPFMEKWQKSKKTS